MEVSRAVASTVEDFTEADFNDVRLQGSALDPTATMTDTIPTRTMTTTTMTAVATLSVAACIPATAGGFDRSRSADNMLPKKTRRCRRRVFACPTVFSPLYCNDCFFRENETWRQVL